MPNQNARLQLCITVIACIVGTGSAAAAEDSFPSFVAEGTVWRQANGSSESNAYDKTEANVVFHSSNGWWQVEVKYVTPKKNTPSVQNCMRIPDGTRRYTLFEGDTRTGMTPAEVCPLTYPPPGLTLMFTGWLSLCPDPELPVIDRARMRRFLNVPTCRIALGNHAQNEGVYTATYLGREQAFLSELILSNNGMALGIGPDNEDEVRPYWPPFENGFTELEYQVIESTNINGTKFPLSSVLRQYAPKPHATDRKDRHLWLSSGVTVNRVTFSAGGGPNRTAAPAQLVALDSRPPGLPKEIEVRYVVTNDQWKPVSDPQLAGLAHAARPPGNPAKTASRWLVALVLASVFLAPLCVFLRKRRRS